MSARRTVVAAQATDEALVESLARTEMISAGIYSSFNQAVVDVYKKVQALPPENSSRAARLDALTKLIGGAEKMLEELAAAEERAP